MTAAWKAGQAIVVPPSCSSADSGFATRRCCRGVHHALVYQPGTADPDAGFYSRVGESNHKRRFQVHSAASRCGRRWNWSGVEGAGVCERHWGNAGNREKGPRSFLECNWACVDLEKRFFVARTVRLVFTQKRRKSQSKTGNLLCAFA